MESQVIANFLKLKLGKFSAFSANCENLECHEQNKRFANNSRHLKRGKNSTGLTLPSRGLLKRMLKNRVLR